MRFTRGLLAVLVGGLVAAGAACGTVGRADVAAEARVVELVNAERAAQGLPPLAANPALGLAAERYAEAMAETGVFSHTGADGSAHTARVEATGYAGWRYTGENLAAGQPTPERVVAAWMKSPTHRANVLSPKATEIGIGHARERASVYGDYWAMETGAR